MSPLPLEALREALPDGLLEALLAQTGIDALQAPERLPFTLTAVALAAILTAAARVVRRPVLAWPGLSEARRAGGTRLEVVPVLAWSLRVGAMACLALAVARPVALDQSPPEPGLGLDLILVLDTSGSMRALDTSFEPSDATPSDETTTGETGSGPDAAADAALYQRTRLDLASRVVSRFATRRVAEGDRVGLVVFGGSAFTQCPLTSDGALLAAALGRVDVGMAGTATALGDALALAVKRAPKTEGGLGRVIVLLTDGRSNAGSIPVDIATELAIAEGLRVHTVGIGTAGGEVPVAARGGRGDRGLRFERYDTDPHTLRRIARKTGGRFFEASRSADLHAVYREIDTLERAPRQLPPRVRSRSRAEPLLAAAGGFLLLEIWLAGVLRRRIP